MRGNEDGVVGLLGCAAVIDPRREAVLIFDQPTGEFRDRTQEIAAVAVRPANGKIDITFGKTSRTYSYGADRVRLLRNAVRSPLAVGARVEVKGAVWGNVSAERHAVQSG